MSLASFAALLTFSLLAGPGLSPSAVAAEPPRASLTVPQSM